MFKKYTVKMSVLKINTKLQQTINASTLLTVKFSKVKRKKT